MTGSNKKKDIWDKLSAITPLLLGIAVTGVAALFTQIYNFQQLQLNKITALEKLRPLLVSDKAEDRLFGYASFVELGYKDIAISIIALKEDQAGRPVLEMLEKSESPQLRANAGKALKLLDEAEVRIDATTTNFVALQAQIVKTPAGQRKSYAKIAEKLFEDYQRELEYRLNLRIELVNDGAPPYILNAVDSKTSILLCEHIAMNSIGLVAIAEGDVNKIKCQFYKLKKRAFDAGLDQSSVTCLPESEDQLKKPQNCP